jgi:rare lipoprotein A
MRELLSTYQPASFAPGRKTLRAASAAYRRLVVLAAFGLISVLALLSFRAVDAPDALPALVVAEMPMQLSPLPSSEVVAEDEPIPLEALEGTRVGSGPASFYGVQFAGRPTASGERFAPEAMTAAHRSLPFGSKVRVTNTRNGRSVIVRINDRGPFHGNRVIDLSKAAAQELGFVRSGTAPVVIELLPVRG